MSQNQNSQDNQVITLVDDEGNETLFNILFTFDSEDFGHSYILLYPADAAADEEVDIQAYIFNPDDEDNGELKPIESDEEWDMVEEVLNTFLADDGGMQ
ncbi:DUF1292 domain-containing protein [Lactiplantibacillus fabifermentans]|uniref:UPF0473 protein DY78_GL002594 n=2 Tax=Lactiplantibacillus fabifermentans TaxID=483011 RepID=A0A0R2NTK4_9LACO|nr:DUF1292 domain-containing protein [Lactiplantibacillus fabifermentans]ETY73833.1 hypothetical protein LFAB_10290 [Lactiplantibacillus fabifermentans T30PCM01]KRO28210.1 hypothetical protein DY78_GL002594 [Lactiplantibacillus fabifermentans DSM 21115]